jgi:hypothetical protein
LDATFPQKALSIVAVDIHTPENGNLARAACAHNYFSAANLRTPTRICCADVPGADLGGLLGLEPDNIPISDLASVQIFFAAPNKRLVMRLKEAKQKTI